MLLSYMTYEFYSDLRLKHFEFIDVLNLFQLTISH